MNTVYLCKANEINNVHQSVQDVTIAFVKDLPLFKTLKEAHEFYDNEACDIVERLVDVLPGAVLDRVLVKLLEHKASYLRVPEK